MIKNSSTQSLKNPGKYVLVFCYLCGREYGSKSFSIHIKTCQQKFRNEQKLKPDSNDKIALPQPPLLTDLILSGTYQSNELKKFNEQAYQIYKYKVLPKCKYCQRTFNFQSLKVHEKGCDKKPKIPISNLNQFDDKELCRPKTLLCCVCGRQFGTKSLKIHYPQCLDKFKNDEFLRCPNPKDRRKPPEFSQEQIELINTKENWTNDEIEEFYKMAMEKYRNQSMLECYNCKRKFVPESIQKHMKNCILINGNLSPELHLKKVQSEKVLHFYQKNIKKPKFLMCYICGRQFGLTSLTIHQKTCYEKFKTEQQNKPKNERKKLPQFPQEIISGNYDISNAQNWQPQKIDKYNQIISDLYNKKTLVQCYICERTFFQQSLPKHLVHCENNLEKLKLKRNKSQDQNIIIKRCQSVQKLKKLQKSVQKDIIKPRVLMCHICGRQFGTASLQIHYKVCIQKFLNEQSKKDKQKRKSLPQLPKQVSSSEYDITNASQWSNDKILFYNKIVSEFYNKKTLQMCPYCERTFIEESLQKHIKHCENYTLQKIKRSPSLNEKQLKILAKHKEIQQQKLEKENQYYAKVEKSIPKTLVCHICGRSYGLSSLQIHLPNCIKMFVDLESKKPFEQRKKLPSIQNQIDLQKFDIRKAETWSKQKIETYNEVCNRIYNHKSLTKCQYCQRTFFEEQIKKHLTYCEKQSLKSLQKSNQQSSNPKNLSLKKSQSLNFGLSNFAEKKVQEPVQLKILFCHICGRQFGIYSLKIHLPQCKEKFIKQEQIKPEQKRKKLPELYFNLNENKENDFDFNIEEAELWNSEKIKKYNQICRQTYMKETLYQCQHCGRSFKQEQLPKHLKFCEKDPFKKIKKTQEEKSQGDSQQKQSKQLYSPQRKVKFQDGINENLSLNVMTIIQEEEMEHSTISPYQNSSPQEEKMKKSLNEFCLNPVQISTPLSDSKPIFQQKNKRLATVKNLNSSYTDLNKSMKDPSLMKQASLGRNLNRSLSYNADLGLGISTNRKQEEKDQKQCQHCKKKVKPDLYQRHIHMCKSNSSMTGYMRKDTTKLKI